MSSVRARRHRHWVCPSAAAIFDGIHQRAQNIRVIPLAIGEDEVDEPTVIDDRRGSELNVTPWDRRRRLPTPGRGVVVGGVETDFILVWARVDRGTEKRPRSAVRRRYQVRCPVVDPPRLVGLIGVAGTDVEGRALRSFRPRYTADRSARTPESCQ